MERHLHTGGSCRERSRQACKLPAVHFELCCLGQIIDSASAERRCRQACNRWDRASPGQLRPTIEAAAAWTLAPTLLLPLLLAPSSRPALHGKAAALSKTSHHLFMQSGLTANHVTLSATEGEHYQRMSFNEGTELVQLFSTLPVIHVLL